MTRRSTLVAQLRALGVAPGDVLMTHASLRRVGKIEGGAAGLIQAQREAVGPEGTLLMVIAAQDGVPFDPLRTPVPVEDMGVLAEVFRTTPGVEVNDHPADRFAAVGPRAAWLLRPSPLHDYHGPGSVLERLVSADGKVLRLGADPDTITLTHHAEYLAAVPHKARVRRRYEVVGQGEVWIESLDDCDGIAQWEGGDYFPEIWLDYRAARRARVGRVGNCTAELLGARDFLDHAVRWLERARWVEAGG